MNANIHFPTLKNNIFLDEKTLEGVPFKSRFIQPGLVKYDFGVCLIKKETIDKFIDTFIDCPLIINHSDNIQPGDILGAVEKEWFSPEDGWFWCSGVIKSDEVIDLIKNQGYSVSCQYRITEWKDNLEGKLHNGNPYDKEILNGVFEHLALVENPRYEGAIIAVNAYITKNAICKNEFQEQDHPRDEDGKFSKTHEESYFKNWDNAPEITLKSSELDNIVDIKELRQAAKEYYKKNLQGKEIDHKQLGKIKISGEKWKEFSHTSADSDKLKLVPQIPEIIQKGKIGKFQPNYKDRKDSIKGFYPIYANLNTKGNIKKVETLIGEDNEGKLFYTMFLDYDRPVAKNKRDITSNQDRLSLNLIIPNQPNNLNPAAKNSLQNSYNKIIDYIKNFKGETMSLEENLFKGLFQALCAKNEAEKDAKNEDVDKRKLIDEIGGILKDKVDEEIWRTIVGKIEKLAYSDSSRGTADNSEEEKAKNEKVDKRDLIRQIMAIAGKREDDEDVRTIAKLAEKLAYSESESESADNKAKNKCKNENEEKEKEYEELKEKVYEEVKNQRAKNALEDVKSLFYRDSVDKNPIYQTREDRLKAGNKY